MYILFLWERTSCKNVALFFKISYLMLSTTPLKGKGLPYSYIITATSALT